MTLSESVGLNSPSPLNQDSYFNQNPQFQAGGLEPLSPPIKPSSYTSNGGGSEELQSAGFELAALSNSEELVLPTLANSPFSLPQIADSSVWEVEESLNWGNFTTQPGQAIVFIDAAVSDVAHLVAGVAPGAEVVVLNAQQDGVAQISQVLAARTNVSSVHIVSFGEPGSLQLGDTILSGENLSAYQSAIAHWSDALSPNADILLYGCNAGDGVQGLAFVQQLSQLTGADVAASTNRTGNAQLGGDWTLEVQTGSIESPLAFQPKLMHAYQSVFDTVRVNSVTVTEGDLGDITNAAFTVNLDRTSSDIVSVVFQTADVTAVSPRDYRGITRTLVFGSTETSRTVTIPVFGNNVVDEDPERFFDVQLTSPSEGVTVGVAQGTGTIIDDDELQVSIQNASVTEGDTGTTEALVTVRLSQPLNQAVTVAFNTVEDTAIAGEDFEQVSGILTFAPNQETQTIRVPVIGDTIVEMNETFFVELSNPSGNAVLGNDRATVTIVEDDQLFLSVTDITVTEGDTGTQEAVFTVSLTPGDLPVTVNYATVADTATAGVDFTPATGSLTFAPGETEKLVTVQVVGDTLPEINETFFLQLSNASGAALTDEGQGTATIIDDDLLISGIKWEDRNNNQRRDANEPGLAGVTVFLDVNDDEIIDEGDRVAVTDASGRYIFDNLIAGEYVVREVVPEGFIQTFPAENPGIGQEEPYRITLEPGEIVENANFGNFLIPVPDVEIQGVTQLEGTNGTTDFNFVVRLSEPTIVPVTVTYTTADQTAVVVQDFQATSGLLTFAPGETEKTIAVPVVADNVIEPTETFLVRLTGSTFGNIVTNEAVGTITDDDLPAISIADVAIPEGNTGTRNAVFTVRLDRPGIVPVTLNYTTQDGTARAGEDYQAVSGSLNFAVGETEKTIAVPVIGDTRIEPDEAFFVVLSDVTDAVVQDSRAIGTITNDDASTSVPPPPSPSPTPPPTPPVDPTPPIQPPPPPPPPPPPTPPFAPPPAPIIDRTLFFPLDQFNVFFGAQERLGGVNRQDVARLLFDESYYLALNPTVAQEVNRGNFRSGFDHFLQFGQFEGRDPSPLFNTGFYLSQNPQVAEAVAQRQLPSAFSHFVQFGLFEGRDPSPLFSNGEYVAQNPGVQNAIAQGLFASGIQHYLQFGQFEGREPRLQLFDETFYLNANPAVAEAVSRGAFSSGLQHYTLFGQFEGRDPSPFFNENFYLSQYPAVAQVVAQGGFRSGFEHYLLFGRSEGRLPRPT